LTFNLTISAFDRADLSLSIAVTPAPALTNATVEWRFTTANGGPRPAPSAELKAELVGNSVSFTELGTCTVVSASDRQQLTCPVPTLAAGANAVVAVRGRAPQSGDIRVTGDVNVIGATPRDPDPNNNRATATLHVADSLSAPMQSLVSPDTQGAAAGDVDGDKFADLALANGAGQGVQIHLNVVDPGNARRRRLDERSTAVGDSPAADVALADLDRDSDLDLVIANNTGRTNDVFLNNGTTFTRAASLAGGKSSAVAVADFDNDGAQDLVFANNGPATVYLNKAGGTFALAAQLGNDESRDVIGVDLDRDNLPDIVLANAKGPSRFYRNLGAGAFAAGVTIEADGAESVASGDFNKDGRPDLVFARLAVASGPPSNPVYQNNAGAGGAPQFVRVASLGASPTIDVAATDADSDGAADVIAINATGTHQVYRGDGAGRFALHPVQFTIDDAVGAALGQISSDARIDVVVAGGKSTGVFINDGKGGFGKGDVTGPTIQLLGDPAVTVPVGEAYNDAGATATDDLDGNLTSSIVMGSDVNTAVIGSYAVTYDVVDSSGNPAAQVTRGVNVAARDNTAGGGGSGAAGDLAVALAILLYLARRRRRI
jgi:MYXO-CTERM domain-containing protein